MEVVVEEDSPDVHEEVKEHLQEEETKEESKHHKNKKEP